MPGSRQKNARPRAPKDNLVTPRGDPHGTETERTEAIFTTPLGFIAAVAHAQNSVVFAHIYPPEETYRSGWVDRGVFDWHSVGLGNGLGDDSASTVRPARGEAVRYSARRTLCHPRSTASFTSSHVLG